VKIYCIGHWTPALSSFTLSAVTDSLTIQGRQLSPAELQGLRQWVGENPHWSRWRLSRELATRWDWRNGAGVLKDMAARTLLVKLAQRGLIRLPERRQVPTNRMRCGQVRADGPEAASEPITGTLAQLAPWCLQEVSRQPAQRTWVQQTLARFHYLGFGGAVGENLQYVVRDGQERPLACLVFGAAAWKCQDRDQYLGWSTAQRERNLALVANNARFLILPWAKVPGLGSWILGRVAARIGRDWQAKYRHPVVVLETFVEQPRFRGTVYRAANWQRVGRTTGRTRQDRHTRIQVAAKDIYVYPLSHGFREALQG
jgi:hypothetical protein